MKLIINNLKQYQMKKVLYVSLVLLALTFATTTGYAQKHVQTTTGAELHAQSSNAP